MGNPRVTPRQVIGTAFKLLLACLLGALARISRPYGIGSSAAARSRISSQARTTWRRSV